MSSPSEKLQQDLAEQTLRSLAMQAMRADGAGDQEASERVRKLFKALRPTFAVSAMAPHPDTLRLDDMERTRCYPFWNGEGWTYIVAAERSSKVERKGIGATVREAIDAALDVPAKREGQDG